MTIAGMTWSGSEGSSRWLLLGSLALNLFFIGVGGALLLQSYEPDPVSPPTASDLSVAGRIERIAGTLPREDAERLRAAYRANQGEIDGTRAAYRNRQEAVSAALRAEPFNLDTLKAAMTDMRGARQAFDRRIHEFFAQQASEMSPAARQKLAERPSLHSGRGASQQQPKN